jgi:hypothetical protein
MRLRRSISNGQTERVFQCGIEVIQLAPLSPISGSSPAMMTSRSRIRGLILVEDAANDQNRARNATEDEISDVRKYHRK